MDYQPLTNNSTAEYIVSSWLQGKPVMFKKTWAENEPWRRMTPFDGKEIFFNFKDCYYRVVE